MAMLAASLPWRAPKGPTQHLPQAPAREGENRGKGAEKRGRVAFLTGCVQDHLFRRVNEATARVLAANGWVVVGVPGQGCCGALHAHGGQLEVARDLARVNLAAFREARVDWIVANAAGCGATMRDYAGLMEEGSAEDREAADWFSERVRDVSEILAGEGRTPRQGGALPLRVAYDPPCHLLHGQRVRNPPLELLRAIPGVELVSVPNGDECCGGAGIYGITHPDLGGKIGRDKVAAVRSTGAAVLATGNPGCAMQIGAGLRMSGSNIQVAHPIELLDESYRRGGVYPE
jgi:glycolate oxidase iron-sulfur subunit